MPPKSRHSFVRLGILLVLLAGAVWVLLNRQFVIDQLTVWQYKPSSDITAIANRASFNDTGRFLFYASRPQISDRAEFNRQCRRLVEKTAILGCYVNRQIFVFDITDQRLDGIKEVTAAHEMLHAAYDRLSTSEKTRVDALISQQAERITDQKLRDRLALYDQTEPGERLNELHSILGSEIDNLSSELETYYKQYFTDRAALVALSNKYETVFNEIEAKQTSLIDELNRLADQVSAASDVYTKALATLQADINNFNARARSGGFTSQAAFNTERDRLLARQEKLQADRLAINANIDVYNQKKAELDALNTTAEGLQKSINSTALPEAPAL
ncbi:MAG: hypothetical protein WBB39_00420 [Candidatus Saccharimonadales bacterium]